MVASDMIDEIIRALDGLVRTDDSKMSERALEAEFVKWRQSALFITWNGSRPTPLFPSGIAANQFLNAKNYLQTTLTYNPAIQDSGADYVLFQGEPPVQLGAQYNGCRFMGDKLSGQTFIQLRDPSDYYTYKSAGLISLNDVCVAITGNYYKVWGNQQLKKIDLDYLPNDPFNIATYDPEVDDYPIGPDVWAIMKKIAVFELTPEAAKPADLINNSAPLQ